MKYYIISGEASGDLHGSNLILELQKRDSLSEVRCWGGDLMQATGATLVKHYRDLAFMGFTEVIKNIGTIFRNLSFCKKDIAAFKPDVLILIDYPGFNLRIAEWARKQGLKIVYYISPQIWAWKESRIHSIKKNVDKMLVILPFEKAFYDKWNFKVEYVGHPLIEVIDKYRASHNGLSLQDSEQVVALLPGSRQQEILKKLPVMLEVARHFPNHVFIVAKAPGLADSFYETLLAPYTNVRSVTNKTYDLLMASKAALVTSGTATLETALFDVPEVICYKGGKISYLIARQLIRIKYICLVNLIMDKEVVRELIQDEMNVENLVAELHRLLHDETRKTALQKDYNELRDMLRKGGHASANAAMSIQQFLQTNS
ncbi:MAG: lipid-A-disaccharide synthase [Chitinophagaceae bacterium]|nr:MAG: lipid-A-disaccharide synthase [Chitinophagaceae bacterium]